MEWVGQAMDGSTIRFNPYAGNRKSRRGLRTLSGARRGEVPPVLSLDPSLQLGIKREDRLDFTPRYVLGAVGLAQAEFSPGYLRCPRVAHRST